MAYTRGFAKLTFGGAIAGGNDIWSCGLSFGGIGNEVAEDSNFALLAAAISDIGDEVQTFIGYTETLVPTGAKLDSIKLAHIGVDGHYLEEAVEIPWVSQGSSNASYVPQNTIVNGLVSNKWKDPGKNNRFYLPSIPPPTTGAYQLSELEAEGYVSRLASFIEALNDIGVATTGLGGAHVAVVSNSGEGYESSVVEVRVGRVIDTQRRRRNKLDEDYQYHDVDA